MNERSIRYGIIACMCSLAAIVIYAIVWLYVLFQRIDGLILLTNVVLFAGISGVLMYLMRKDKDLEEERLFRE